MKQIYNHIEFTVPAMEVPMYTTDKVTGKKVKKRDELGRVVTVAKVLPKERPRFSVNKGKFRTYSTVNTSSFEEWIRKSFFNKYKSNHGIYSKGKVKGTHSYFIGCKKYGEETYCTDFRKGQDYKNCKVCKCRRKNLRIDLVIFLKDDRHIDGDNILKIVLDALNGVCFYDDTQFTIKYLIKIPYAKTERLAVRIYEVVPQWVSESIIATYPIKNLPLLEAKKYVTHLYDTLGAERFKQGFEEFVKRCDKRNLL